MLTWEEATAQINALNLADFENADAMYGRIVLGLRVRQIRPITRAKTAPRAPSHWH